MITQFKALVNWQHTSKTYALQTLEDRVLGPILYLYGPRMSIPVLENKPDWGLSNLKINLSEISLGCNAASKRRHEGHLLMKDVTSGLILVI